MSQENVEVVRAAYDAWNAGNMDALRELYDPDAIMRMDENWPEPGPYFGRDAVMREFEQLREAWDADTIEAISDFIDAGDRVVVRVAWRGVGRGPEIKSGVHDRLHGPQRPDLLPGALHRSCGGPRSRGAVGARRSRRLLSLRDTAGRCRSWH